MTRSARVCEAKPTDAQDPEKPHASRTPGDKSTASHHAGSDWATDARNPLNWSSARRWTIIVVLAITNFVAYVACLLSLWALVRLVNPTTGP